MRRALIQILVVLVMVLAAPAAAADGPAFDWSMPDRLGPDRNGDGLIDYADSAWTVASGPFSVDLEVRRDLCRRLSTFRWSIDGRLVGGGRAACRLEQSFATEGSYDVELDIESPGGDRRSYSRTIHVQDWLVVSIGDSVASGEGNPDKPGLARRARWQSSRCHRSTLAAPPRAALALERSDPRTSTTFVHLACSGAALQEGLLHGYEGADVPDDAEPKTLPPQLAELEAIASQRQIDVVLISAGANDLHFSSVVKFCIRFRNCTGENFDPERPGTTPDDPGARLLPAVISASLARLHEGYRELAARLERVVEPGQVVIVDYFDPTKDSNGETCGRIGPPFFNIDRDEADWAYANILAPLNSEIALAADRYGWVEVTGVAEAFEKHGYCAKGQSWIRTLGRSLFTQAGAKPSSRAIGTLHPNQKGHQATATLIDAALRRTLYSTGMPPEPPRADDSEIVGAGESKAGEEEDGGGGCGCSEESAEDRCGCHLDDSGEGLEWPAAIGLSAAIVAGLLTLIAASLWSRIDRRGANRQGWETDAESEIPPLPADRWPPPRDVERFGALLERSNEWVHRRVESIEFLDESTIRRRISVDFTPGGSLPAGSSVHAPIALLHKGVLTRFDLRDEAGGSLPLLTANQNAAFATAHMLSIAERVVGGPVPERLRKLCWTIARAEPSQANRAIEEIAQRLQPEEVREKLRDDSRFRSVTQTFADNFPVIVEAGDPTKRRVVKLAYDEILGRRPRLLVRLGLRPLALTIGMPELGDAGSRHIEFLRADGLETFDPALIARTPEGKPLVRRAAAGVGREVHLLVTDAPRGTAGVAGVRLRVKREGVLVGGPLLAALAAALLSVTWFALPELAGNSSEAASVLLAIPAALGAYLGARSPHPLVAAMLGGARILLFVSGFLSFAAASALALDCSVETLRVVLGVAAPLSWLTAGGLATIWVFPRAPRRIRPGAL
jgi:lysophospholipase L1-like esterase